MSGDTLHHIIRWNVEKKSYGAKTGEGKNHLRKHAGSRGPCQQIRWKCIVIQTMRMKSPSLWMMCVKEVSLRRLSE
jgi:hypothetical protein